jgi:hypothetical protein
LAPAKEYSGIVSGGGTEGCGGSDAYRAEGGGDDGGIGGDGGGGEARDK